MLKVECARCGEELDDPGGLLFGAPSAEICRKYHLCWTCVQVVVCSIIEHRTEIIDA